MNELFEKLEELRRCLNNERRRYGSNEAEAATDFALKDAIALSKAPQPQQVPDAWMAELGKGSECISHEKRERSSIHVRAAFCIPLYRPQPLEQP